MSNPWVWIGGAGTLVALILLGIGIGKLIFICLVCSDNPPEEANSDESVSNAELLENAKDLP